MLQVKRTGDEFVFHIRFQDLELFLRILAESGLLSRFGFWSSKEVTKKSFIPLFGLFLFLVPDLFFSKPAGEFPGGVNEVKLIKFKLKGVDNPLLESVDVLVYFVNIHDGK